jgi:hypothetical protein
MRAVAYKEDLGERVRPALASRTDVDENKMFGGLSGGSRASFVTGGTECRLS